MFLLGAVIYDLIKSYQEAVKHYRQSRRAIAAKTSWEYLASAHFEKKAFARFPAFGALLHSR